MTHLENHILESSDDENSQEESYEDYIYMRFKMSTLEVCLNP